MRGDKFVATETVIFFFEPRNEDLPFPLARANSDSARCFFSFNLRPANAGFFIETGKEASWMKYGDVCALETVEWRGARFIQCSVIRAIISVAPKISLQRNFN